MSELEMASAALVALAEHGIPTDVQELLVYGNPERDIAPGAFSKAVRAVLSVAQTQPNPNKSHAAWLADGLESKGWRDYIGMAAIELRRVANAQAVAEPQWTEDELALAFFDYSACEERRCGWTEPGDCDCRNAARRAVHWIKHVLPRSFPLASSVSSTEGK